MHGYIIGHGGYGNIRVEKENSWTVTLPREAATKSMFAVLNSMPSIYILILYAGKNKPVLFINRLI